jgi:hypothetical protein
MDANTLAKSIVDQAIGDKPTKKPNPLASKRGEARASILTTERKVEIAKMGAETRWRITGTSGEK